MTAVLLAAAVIAALSALVADTLKVITERPNFMVIGMAAVLSGSIHAPVTAIFLVCAVIDNCVLFIPIGLACLISKFIAHLVFPFTVYTCKDAGLVADKQM